MTVLRLGDDKFNEDRLSELPDSLIFHILGFLEKTDVVRTTVLSNRWKNLWTTITCLDFNEWRFDDTDGVRNFVNGALKFWRGTSIRKFKLHLCFKVDKSLFGDVDSWVYFVTENGVEELDLRLMYLDYDENEYICNDNVYWVPQCLYSCSSLKELSLTCCNLAVNENVQWDRLESLTIHSSWLGEHAINQVMSGCPKLEALILCFYDIPENLNIRSSSLKRLLISKALFCDHDVPLMSDTELGIWAPNLETLELSKCPYGKCLLMDVSSLTRVTLEFADPSPSAGARYGFSWNDFIGEALRQIFAAIQHVERVTLSNWCIKVLGGMNKKYLVPPLLHASYVELDRCCFKDYNQIVNVLDEIFPEVKMLVLVTTPYAYFSNREDNGESESCSLNIKRNPPKSFLLQLRTVEVRSKCNGWVDTSLFQLLKFLVKYANHLEKIVFCKRKKSITYDVEVFRLTGSSADQYAEILRIMKS